MLLALEEGESKIAVPFTSSGFISKRFFNIAYDLLVPISYNVTKKLFPRSLSVTV